MPLYQHSDERYKDERLEQHEAAAAMRMTYDEYEACRRVENFIVRLMWRERMA